MCREFCLAEHDAQISLDDAIFDSDGTLKNYRVRLANSGLSAEVRVDHSLIFQGMPAFFRELADAWRGWNGEKNWRTAAADFLLVATCDSRGHINIKAIVRPDSATDSWRASTSVSVEAGQLDRIFNRVDLFFRAKS